MTLDDLRRLLETYGANPERWPSDQRESARVLIAGSAAAQALAAAAARLDAALDLVSAPEPSAELFSRVLADAPVNRSQRRVVARWAMAATVPLAIAAAVLIWLLPRRQATAPDLTQVAISDLGVYVTPTDVLLAPPGLDLSRSAPAVGCVDDGLGCPLPDLPVDRQSRSLMAERVFG